MIFGHCQTKTATVYLNVLICTGYLAKESNLSFLLSVIFRLDYCPIYEIMSGYTAEQLQTKLSKELETSHCEVTDLSDGCGSKFSALIVSAKFEGKPLLGRHRLVNSVLEEEMKTIHAFTQKTLTPEQWASKQAAA